MCACGYRWSICLYVLICPSEKMRVGRRVCVYQGPNNSGVCTSMMVVSMHARECISLREPQLCHSTPLFFCYSREDISCCPQDKKPYPTFALTVIRGFGTAVRWGGEKYYYNNEPETWVLPQNQKRVC